MINYGEIFPGYKLMYGNNDMVNHEELFYIIKETHNSETYFYLGEFLVEEKNEKFEEIVASFRDSHWEILANPIESYKFIQAALLVEPTLLDGSWDVAAWLIDRAARLVKLQALK